MTEPRNPRSATFHRTNMSDRVRCSECGAFVLYRDGDTTHALGHARIMHGVSPLRVSFTDNPYNRKDKS